MPKGTLAGESYGLGQSWDALSCHSSVEITSQFQNGFLITYYREGLFLF